MDVLECAIEVSAKWWDWKMLVDWAMFGQCWIDRAVASSGSGVWINFVKFHLIFLHGCWSWLPGKQMIRHFQSFPGTQELVGFLMHDSNCLLLFWTSSDDLFWAYGCISHVAALCKGDLGLPPHHGTWKKASHTESHNCCTPGECQDWISTRNISALDHGSLICFRSFDTSSQYFKVQSGKAPWDWLAGRWV